MQPVTRYAKSGDVHIAYLVFGDGPINLILAPYFVSNIEVYWEHPAVARWLLRLASSSFLHLLELLHNHGGCSRSLLQPSQDQSSDLYPVARWFCSV